MIFTTLALALPALVAAQYGAPPDSASSSSTASAASSVPSAPADTPGHMNIDVAFHQTFVFNPPNITAPNGTIVTFYFPSNGLTHSVTQSSFGSPCAYLAANGSNPGGFDSGLTQGTQFSINITNDQAPIWFHCKQLLHCGMGMVGSINAPSSGNTFTAFQAAAKAIGSSETTEQDKGPVTGGVNAIATATPAATASGSAPAASGSAGGKSSGAERVVGSRISGLVAIALAMFMA